MNRPESEPILATRLTMLATQLAPSEGRRRLADNKVNFVSFTPSTSFNMGNSAGNSRERVVLFRLLEPVIPERQALMNLLQGNVTRRFPGIMPENPRFSSATPVMQCRSCGSSAL